MISKEDFLVKNTVYSDNLRTKILSYREQEKIVDAWLKERFETVLPRIMKRADIDAWVIACNEYNEDPLISSITPVAMITARRKMILFFHLKEDGSVERLVIGRPNIGLDGYYESVWTNPKGSIWCKDPSKAESQMECLNRIINERNVKKIGLNFSKHFAFADGLSKTLYDEIMEGLDVENQKKVVSAEKLCVGWLETRSKSEMAAYTGIMQIAHSIIDEAFSSRVVVPGVTTNADVKYFMLQNVIDLGLQPWFDFSVEITRENVGTIEEETIIMPGDLLHCDVGLRYLGLCTDTQEQAYILRIGEDDAPAYLKKLLKDTNRLQDIVLSNFVEGRTGNEILALSLKKAKEEGLNPCIYTHPIGYHGHAAGPTIGLYDQQNGVPFTGDYPLYNDTAYSLELNCRFDVPEMGIKTSIGLETDVLFTNDQTYYLAGRQENFHLIK